MFCLKNTDVEVQQLTVWADAAPDWKAKAVAIAAAAKTDLNLTPIEPLLGCSQREPYPRRLMMVKWCTVGRAA